MRTSTIAFGAWILSLLLSGVVARADEPLVGAYYYPWYHPPRGKSGAKSKKDLGWMKRALRGRLLPRQMPKLGVYESREPKVIADHIAQSERANIDFWVVSWWGPKTDTDGAFEKAILPHSDAEKLKYALFYEPTGRLGAMKNPNHRNFLPDMRYAAKKYFDSEHYLKIDGKPVLFIYLTRVYFRNRGLEELAQLRKEFPNLYLVGDDVFGPRYRVEYAKLWDAVTAYDVYGQSLARTAKTTEALERLKSIYTNAKTIANSVDVAFAPAVSPGFNDRAVRSGHEGRARYFADVKRSKEGDVFRRMIRDIAMPLADERANRMILVTSFNEWYEDTQIEATRGDAGETKEDDSNSRDHYTQGDRYVDYGTLYLDILREETTPKKKPEKKADEKSKSD